MASFGKLTTAFLQASQETTLAFANFNFDFALIKYDAPEEYRGLGDSLSRRRKDAAEDGPIHIIARKLSALFQTIIPEVSYLIQAYGRRATEIAKSPSANPKDTSKAGVFADHIGADGTTIWATATSGDRAVTIHLLACILARIWTRTHAISVWSELIEQRREDLRQKLAGNESSFQISDIAASRVEISRSQLDDWDASARSWLQTADEANKFKQTQLRLILDNVSLPVSNQSNVFTAVIEAWTTALLALEHLITGTPQRIQDGAVLLGLSAWHLCPDMFVLGDRCQHIKQADPLISPGGIITIGLQGKTEELDNGVFWSLPLAHMYYYGDPVLATGHTGIRESKVTFDEFVFVVLGSILTGWSLSNITPEAVLQVIPTLAEAMKVRNNSQAVKCTQWLTLLASAVAQMGTLGGTILQQVTRLVSFGQRRCFNFLSHISFHPPPVFGLTDIKILLDSFENDINLEIKMLRGLALRLSSVYKLQNPVIRYQDNYSSKFKYTSVDPTQVCGGKRRRNSQGHEVKPPNLTWLNEEELNSHVWSKDSQLIEERRHCVWMPPKPGDKATDYIFVCGNAKSAAIFAPTRQKSKLKAVKNEMDVKDLISLIGSGDIDPSRLISKLQDPRHIGKFSSYFQSLQAVHEAGQVYRHLREARVDLQVTSLTLSLSKWGKNCSESAKGSNTHTLQKVFCCIALFETGSIDVDPSMIGDDVIAMCNASSIFVASELLLDPITGVPEVPVERMTGNIGKPGLAFLITPPNPKIRSIDYQSWNAINHEPFNGHHKDNFTSTSLHLSFTGYELPLDLGQRGARVAPALFIETAVSIYDRGEWMADLDIMKSCKSWAGMKQKKYCAHNQQEKADMAFFMPLVCVDSWLEYLDQPLQNSVVRASGNAMARLAAAALAAQQSRTFLIIPEEACWQCLGLTVQAQMQQAKEGENESDNSHNFEVSNNSHKFESPDGPHNFKDSDGSHNFEVSNNPYRFENPDDPHNFEDSDDSRGFEDSSNVHNSKDSDMENSNHSEASEYQLFGKKIPPLNLNSPQREIGPAHIMLIC